MWGFELRSGFVVSIWVLAWGSGFGDLGLSVRGVEFWADFSIFTVLGASRDQNQARTWTDLSSGNGMSKATTLKPL